MKKGQFLCYYSWKTCSWTGGVGRTNVFGCRSRSSVKFVQRAAFTRPHSDRDRVTPAHFVVREAEMRICLVVTAELREHDKVKLSVCRHRADYECGTRRWNYTTPQAQKICFSLVRWTSCQRAHSWGKNTWEKPLIELVTAYVILKRWKLPTTSQSRTSN